MLTDEKAKEIYDIVTILKKLDNNGRAIIVSATNILLAKQILDKDVS